MSLLNKKKEIIKNKKKELSPYVIEMGLYMLFIEPNNVFENVVEKGVDEFFFIDDIDKLYDIKEEKTVVLDITDKNYDEYLDNIATAKHLNSSISVIVKDIVLEEYQVYLSRVYYIDALMFDISYLTTQTVKNIIPIAESMGITPIISIKSEMDLSKIDWSIVKIVSLYDDALKSKIPQNIKIVKDIDSPINPDYADVVVKEDNN
jgi:hypothetical protein